MFKRAGLVILLAASALAAAVMHNGDVVRLVRRGAPVTEIVSSINNSQPGFALFPEDVNSLREDGVPDVVIRAMVARQGGDKLEIGGNAQTAFQPVGSPVSNAYVAPVPARGLVSSARYGIERGTVTAFGGSGILWVPNGGVRANFGGEVSAGLSRYIGVFGQGSYAPLGGAGFPVGVAGIEAVASNSQRIVPYAKLGGGYAWLTGFGVGAPVISPGGGIRVYVSNRFGFSADILALCGVRGGGVVVEPTLGFFLQSK